MVEEEEACQRRLGGQHTINTFKERLDNFWSNQDGIGNRIVL